MHRPLVWIPGSENLPTEARADRRRCGTIGGGLFQPAVSVLPLVGTRQALFHASAGSLSRIRLLRQLQSGTISIRLYGEPSGHQFCQFFAECEKGALRWLSRWATVVLRELSNGVQRACTLQRFRGREGSGPTPGADSQPRHFPPDCRAEVWD